MFWPPAGKPPARRTLTGAIAAALQRADRLEQLEEEAEEDDDAYFDDLDDEEEDEEGEAADGYEEARLRGGGGGFTGLSHFGVPKLR